MQLSHENTSYTHKIFTVQYKTKPFAYYRYEAPLPNKALQSRPLLIYGQ